MNELPHQPELTPTYEPTPEGLGLALEEAISRYESAIVHREAEKGDLQGLTGGDELVLYPDPTNPRTILRVGPVGPDADRRRFPARMGLHVNYDARKVVDTFRVYGDQGNRRVEQWKAHPELQGAIDPMQPIDSEKYAGLIDALNRASPEKPAGRSRQMLRALGNLSRRGAAS
jgi:hypothetical protein